ncbi:ABC transporter permease [Candidatus Sumerlaeota bacterium]|nr:ABC transporter permease [Candidatus Sumerlaeota bacterium]
MKRIAAHFIAALLLIACSTALIAGWSTLWRPPEYQPPQTAARSYDSAAMREAMDWRAVEREQEMIFALGSRFIGQPGHAAALDYLRKSFEQDGLELIELHGDVAAPRTTQCTSNLPDVGLFPLLPNYLQPVTTPPDGLSGELVLVTGQILHERARFDGCIALIDTADGSIIPDYGCDWTRFAALGFRAVIVSHLDGLDAANWSMIAQPGWGMISDEPVDYPRFAASREIFQHAGERMNIRAHAEFARLPITTLIAVLRANESAMSEEALLILGHYDACSILPDRAPGTVQALSPATQIALARAMAANRKTLTRDVVFICDGARMMARAGEAQLIAALDTPSVEPSVRRAKIQQRLDQERQARENADVVLELFQDKSFFDEADATAAALKNLNEEQQTFFAEQTQHALLQLTFELKNIVMERRIAMEMEDNAKTRSAWNEARKAANLAQSLSSLDITRLLESQGTRRDFLQTHYMRESCIARFAELRDWHASQCSRRESELAAFDALKSYRKLIVFEPRLAPVVETGDPREEAGLSYGTNNAPAALETSNLLRNAARQLREADPLAAAVNVIENENRNMLNNIALQAQPLEDLGARMWSSFGHPAATLWNLGRGQTYRSWSWPADLPYMHDVECIQASLQLTGEFALAVAHGAGRFEAPKPALLRPDFGGRVLADGVGSDPLPSFGLAGAVVAGRPLPYSNAFNKPGFYIHPLLLTDPYGRYELENAATDFWVFQSTSKNGYGPVAAWHDASGRIAWIKDEGEEGQRQFQSTRLNWFFRDLSNVNIVAFRAEPVCAMELVNPQTLEDYSGLRLLDRETLSPFRRSIEFSGIGLRLKFIEPEKRFFVALESGSPEQPNARSVRAFMLGAPRQDVAASMSDAERLRTFEGYLAAARPRFDSVAFEAARSMTALNAARLADQERFGMADERLVEYQREAERLLEQSADRSLPAQRRREIEREALTYAALNHPVLRRNVWEAMISALWHLMLAAPFAFFAERLLFGYADLRARLAARAALFIAVFIALWALHPAFHLARSPLIILLGFVVLFIAAGMMQLFAGRFQDAVDALRGRAAAPEGTRAMRITLAGAAFMLGVNNLRRRPVRTGLTLATITLMAAAIIALTAVREELVDSAAIVGAASYDGLLIKRERFRTLTSPEVQAVKQRYGRRFRVCPRIVLTGEQWWKDRKGYNPELRLERRTAERAWQAEAGSIICLKSGDPLWRGVRMLTRRKGFAPEHERESGELPVMISDRMAERLGLTVSDVDAETTMRVRINGTACRVHGIFEAESLARWRDLDGLDALPFDIEALPEIRLDRTQALADPNAPRIPAEEIVLAPYRALPFATPRAQHRMLSIAVDMSGAPPAEVRAEVERYLEQSGRAAHYGVESLAWKGRKRRLRSLEGWLTLLAPLLIVMLTVFNTMTGAAQERRGEIRVLNAIGVSPRHVFFMFLAEALVYVTIASLCGFMLSQGAGRIAAALGWGEGLQLSYASLLAVQASWGVAAAALLAALLPARAALRMTRPSDRTGWELREPSEGELEFELPFLLPPDRTAPALEAAMEFLVDHGHGATGFAVENLVRESAVEIHAVLWLKPFERGVAQDVCIRAGNDMSGRVRLRVTLRHQSGGREAWRQMNRRFIARLRRHMLLWHQG